MTDLPNRRSSYTHDRAIGRAGRAVYLARDVRDVVLSEHRWIARGGTQLELSTFVRDFSEGRSHLFGSWNDHVRYWLDFSLKDALLVVRFEDLRSDPRNISAIAMFIGLDPSDEAVHRAVDDNSLERMRAKEERPVGGPAAARHRGAVRGQGAVGGWRSKLTQEEVDEAVEHVSRDGLSRWAIRPSSRRLAAPTGCDAPGVTGRVPRRPPRCASARTARSTSSHSAFARASRSSEEVAGPLSRWRRRSVARSPGRSLRVSARGPPARRSTGDHRGRDRRPERRRRTPRRRPTPPSHGGSGTRRRPPCGVDRSRRPARPAPGTAPDPAPPDRPLAAAAERHRVRLRRAPGASRGDVNASIASATPLSGSRFPANSAVRASGRRASGGIPSMSATFGNTKAFARLPGSHGGLAALHRGRDRAAPCAPRDRIHVPSDRDRAEPDRLVQDADRPTAGAIRQGMPRVPPTGP